MPRSFTQSNGMLSWCGVVGGVAFSDLIVLLLGAIRIAQEGSPDSLLSQHPLQVDQRRYRYAWRPHLHSGTDDRIEHPGCHHGHHTGRNLHINKAPRNPLFAVLTPKTPPIKRVPPVVDDNFIADMGRMFMRLS